MNVHPERVADYLQHILDAIERATGYAAQLDGLEAFTLIHSSKMPLFATSR